MRQDNWLSVADDYANQRGITGWPRGTGWPRQGTNADDTNAELDAADATTAQKAAGKIARAKEQRRNGESISDHPAGSDSQIKDANQACSDLGFCNIWVGSTMQRTKNQEPPKSKKVDADKEWLLMDRECGITVVYFPFMSNPKIEGVDPKTSSFMSTWNFVYTPEQIDKVVALARANFNEGSDQMKKAIRAVYERKKAKRLDMEERGKIRKWNSHLQTHGDLFG